MNKLIACLLFPLNLVASEPQLCTPVSECYVEQANPSIFLCPTQLPVAMTPREEVECKKVDANYSYQKVGDNYRLSGTIKVGGELVCGLVLANGQHTFTCGDLGKFELIVPTDGNGTISLFGFVVGSLPYYTVIEVER